MAQSRNKKSKSFIPSTASPTHGRKGCLCKNGRTYSRKCCDGSVVAQGIGKIRLSYYFQSTMTINNAYENWGYRKYYPQIGSLTSNFWYNNDYEVTTLTVYPPSKSMLLEFENANLPPFNRIIINEKPFRLSDAVQSNPIPSITRLRWDSIQIPFDLEVGKQVDIKGM